MSFLFMFSEFYDVGGIVRPTLLLMRGRRSSAVMSYSSSCGGTCYDSRCGNVCFQTRLWAMFFFRHINRNVNHHKVFCFWSSAEHNPAFFKLCRISLSSCWGTRRHVYTTVWVRVQRVQGLDRQAERTVTLALASCVLLLLLLLPFRCCCCCGRHSCCCCCMLYDMLLIIFVSSNNPNQTARIRRCSFVFWLSTQHSSIPPAWCIADLTTAGTRGRASLPPITSNTPCNTPWT